MTVALVVISVWLVVTTAVGILAGRHRALSVEEYFVAGRSFGLVLFYVTAAAEIYSAFAFLGLAGWAATKGASILYAPAYGAIAYGLYFFIGPRINRIGRAMGYVSQPDFLADRYGSRWLGVAVAVVGVVFTLPYLQLQVMGTGMIVHLASGGAVSWQGAVLVSFVAAVVFVYVSGLRGIAWTSLLQAIVMLGGMFALGVLFPARYYGGLRPMFEALLALEPDHLTLPDSSGLGIGWYVSTALLSGLGFWMWPHIVMATYGAKSERVVRRNATLLPLFQLALLPVILVGFTCAARAGTDPAFAARVTNPDHAMLVALVDDFPPIVAGLIGAGGLAAALSTATALILSSATLLARNVVQQGFRRGMDDAAVVRLGRLLVPGLTAAAVVLAFAAPSLLVNLLLVGYSGITQFFPAVVLGLFARWPSPAGIGAGLFAGIATVVACQLGGVRPPAGLHPGFLGLLVNLAAVAVVSPLSRSVDPARLARFERALGTDSANGA